MRSSVGSEALAAGVWPIGRLMNHAHRLRRESASAPKGFDPLLLHFAGQGNAVMAGLHAIWRKIETTIDANGVFATLTPRSSTSCLPTVVKPTRTEMVSRVQTTAEQSLKVDD
jgi:hypothetical protein